MSDTRGATRREALQQFQQPVNITDSRVTGTLDAATASEIITLAVAAEKVSFQASGTLTGNVLFSIDGINFTNTTAIGGSNAIVTFSSHLVKVLRVDRVAGTGKLHILAR